MFPLDWTDSVGVLPAWLAEEICPQGHLDGTFYPTPRLVFKVLVCVITLKQVSRTTLIQDTDVAYAYKLSEKKIRTVRSSFSAQSVPLDFSSYPKPEKLMTELGVSLIKIPLLTMFTYNTASSYLQHSKNKLWDRFPWWFSSKFSQYHIQSLHELLLLFSP